MNRISALLSVVAAACLVLAVACGGSDPGSQGEEATPARAERAAATRSPVKVTPEPTPEPTPAPAPGWTRHTTGDFEIDLPDSWQTWDPTAETDEAVVQALEATNPELAEAATEEECMCPTVFAAIDTGSLDYITNVDVSRQDLPLPVTIGAAIASLEEESGGLGITVLSTDSELSIDGARAGRMDVTWTLGEYNLRQVQYLVLPEPTTAYMLTFSTTAEDYPSLKPVFEKIAESFRAVGSEG